MRRSTGGCWPLDAVRCRSHPSHDSVPAQKCRWAPVAPGTKETPGSTTSLIITHVRRCAGDDGVAAVLARAGLSDRIDDLLDETRWASYDDKIALFEAAAAELSHPGVAFDIGTTILDGPVGEL